MNYLSPASSFFAHLAFAASLARSLRSSGVMFAEDLRPPLDENAEISFGTVAFFFMPPKLTG